MAPPSSSNLQRYSNRRKKQTKLQFEPVASSSPLSSVPPSSPPGEGRVAEQSKGPSSAGLSPARVLFSGSKKGKKAFDLAGSPSHNAGSKLMEEIVAVDSSGDEQEQSSKKLKFDDARDDSSSDSSSSSPAPRSRRRKPTKQFFMGGNLDPKTPTKSQKKTSGQGSSSSKKRKQAVEISDDSSDAFATDDEAIPTKKVSYKLPTPRQTQSSGQARITRSSTKKAPDDSDEDSDDVIPSNIPSSSRRPRRPIVVSDDDSDEDVLPSSSRRSQKPVVVSDDESDQQDNRSNQQGNDSDSDVIILSPRKRAAESPDSDAVLYAPSPAKRQRVDIKGKGKATDVREKKPRRTTKQKQLEFIRRKKAGEKLTSIDDLTASESEEEPGRGLYDTDDELQALSDFPDEEEEVEEIPKKKAKRTRQSSAQAEDEYESDFVTDGEDGEAENPLAAIPIEFTHAARKPLKDHFKDVVEWMVHNKINPAFARDDEVYERAFRSLKDEVTGYAGSKFISAVWRPEFVKALKARPLMQCFDFSNGILQGMNCDACGRSKHPVKFSVTFDGKAYYEETLEEIEKADSGSENGDHDGEESDSAASIDRNGAALPPNSKTWYLGRTCKGNAEMGHTLLHWKYHLNEWVIDRLEQDGLLDAEHIVAREKMKRRDREKDANKVVDDWEKEGTIKDLWGDFKRSLEAAREAKTDGRGWGR